MSVPSRAVFEVAPIFFLYCCKRFYDVAVFLCLSDNPQPFIVNVQCVCNRLRYRVMLQYPIHHVWMIEHGMSRPRVTATPEVFGYPLRIACADIAAEVAHIPADRKLFEDGIQPDVAGEHHIIFQNERDAFPTA